MDRLNVFSVLTITLLAVVTMTFLGHVLISHIFIAPKDSTLPKLQLKLPVTVNVEYESHDATQSQHLKRSCVPWHIFPVQDHEETELAPSNVTPNISAVQALHLTLYGNTSMAVTWLYPRQFVAGYYTPVCNVTVDGVTYHTSRGRSYTYSGGCFDLTLSTVMINVTKFSREVNTKVHYRCGDSRHGWSRWNTFKMEKTGVLDDSHGKNTGGQETPQNTFTSELSDNVVYMDRSKNKLPSSKLFRVSQMYSSEAMNNLFLSKQSLIALVGDMSVPYGDRTVNAISKLTDEHVVKLLIHAGDISYANRYDSHDVPINNSYIWNDYMNKMADITSQIPYMTAPGNHENQFNFAAYENWFPIPNKQSVSASSMWYSFDYMGVHFVSFSTEHDFSQGSQQNDWIKSDLLKANTNRVSVPWIVIFGHRPFYCSSLASYAKKRCTMEASYYRAYLEDILHEAKVDVHVCGHNHDYERSYPVYKQKATSYHYNNPQATVYIVNGEAGNVEGNHKVFDPDTPWRAFFNPNLHTGFLLMQPLRHQLKFVYIDSTLSKPIDSFTITKS